MTSPSLFRALRVRTVTTCALAALAAFCGWEIFAQQPRQPQPQQPRRVQEAPAQPPQPRQSAEQLPNDTKPDPKPPTSFLPVVPDEPLEVIMERESANKPEFDKRQQDLLSRRYDLSDNPSTVMMSGGRKAVQQGVRVKLPDGVTWDDLARMTPAQIKEQNLFPEGFRPLPHSRHPNGGQVFPKTQIDAIAQAEARDLKRFDTEFDLPDHLTPEFPPPIFLSNRPELGDVSNGEVVTIKNFFRLFNGKLTPVQLEGFRLLLTPFPQQQFNPTDDRKSVGPELGVSCFDCHTNGHTNAAFHLTPDIRPQENRFRIDTPSLRGVFNQQIHGSKRSLRSIEDFSEFEQRTAYFDGDHVIAMKKGVHLPDRHEQVAMMAQMQNMLDFPPAPKLDVFGRLDPNLATEQELFGEELFLTKARCAECHTLPFFLDHQMHDLRLGRFTAPGDGPMKTFTLRGIKDSPPYLHDGRLMTLDDTVEFFNLVLGLKLTAEEKAALVAYMLCL